jgi:REP element-mobilizing transposase RayT
MALNEFGEIVQYTWDDLPNHIAGIELDAFVIMPNHVHGIIVITGAGLEQKDRAGLEPAPTGTRILPEIVRQLKTFSARRINKKRGTPGLPVWQRNYYEHIIRDEEDLTRIREYIVNNPVNWQTDENYVAVAGDSSTTVKSGKLDASATIRNFRTVRQGGKQ